MQNDTDFKFEKRINIAVSIFFALALLFFVFALGVFKAEASDLLFEQTNTTATSTQSGTGFTGMRFFGINPPDWVVDRVGFYVNSFSAGGTHTAYLNFRSSDNSIVASTSPQTITTGWNYFNITPQSLVSYGNDMRIQMILSSAGTLSVPYTSFPTAPPTEDYRIYHSSGSQDAYPAMRIYGIDPDNPFPGGFQTRIISQIQPLNGALTADDVVQFEFTYFVNDTDEQLITHAGVDIRDLTTGFEYIPLEDEVIASGQSTFSQIAGLEEAHYHMWRPYLRNASSTRIIYGSWRSFDVVSYSAPFEQIPTDGSPSATSTMFGALFGMQGYLASRFPIAYFYDVAGIVATIDDEMAETNFPTLTLHTGSSTMPMGDLVFLSKDTVEMFAGDTTVTLFRTLMGAFLWIVFAFGVFYQIKKLI